MVRNHECFLEWANFSFPAYIGLMDIYGYFSYTMNHEDFQHFIDPANEVGQLLQAHFVVVQLLLSPITVHELGDRKFDLSNHQPIRWLGAIFQRITPRMQEFYEWPRLVAAGVRRGSFFTELCIKQQPDTLQEDDDMCQAVLNRA
jgi:hypothetical protein